MKFKKNVTELTEAKNRQKMNTRPRLTWLY